MNRRKCIAAATVVAQMFFVASLRTLDTSTSPKRMTITSTNGPNRGKTFLAIYEMKDAGSLRVSYDVSGTDFPTKFKAPKRTSLHLTGYRSRKP
jgi:uncharacterized protein (TIGR03067 family)